MTSPSRDFEPAQRGASETVRRAAEREYRIRLAVFEWLDMQMARGNYEFSRAQLAEFVFEGERINLANTGGGIRTPKGFRAVLSLVSSTDRRTRQYADEIDEHTGTVSYRYQEEKAKRNVTANAGVRAAMPDVPIVYFQGVRDGWFVPHYPAYVTGDDPVAKTFTITLDQELTLFADPIEFNAIQRQYVERIVKYRVHQRPFRAQVLRAYNAVCAVCRLSLPQLLDAAHIVGDAHTDGLPRVSNGLSLCKLHHAAYDRNLLGVTSSGQIVMSGLVTMSVNSDIHRSVLSDFDGEVIVMPADPREQPDRELLGIRFEEFATLG